MRHNGRKWTGFRWRLGLDALVVVGAVFMAFFDKGPATFFVAAGFADLTANFATYFTVNVVQKNIISKNYIAELDKE